MPKASQVDGKRLQVTMRDAVRRVYERDDVLIRERAHERSVLFHIGRRVAAAIDEWPEPWQVDLEYNRVHEDKLERLRKYLPVTPERNEGSVFPDLIVHDRSESSADANLLVMEAKYAPTPADRKLDYGKLRGFREVFRYRVTVFLEFPPFPAPPRWLWCDALDRDRTVLVDPETTPPPMW